MRLLQRMPIVAEASGSTEERQETVYQAAQRLLRASKGLLPYTGALVKHALSDEELANCDILSSQPLETASFLEPANRAMFEHWASHPEDRRFRLGELSLAGIAHEPTITHTDQQINDQLEPTRGPLTATLTLTGSVRYYLTVSNHDVFKKTGAQGLQNEVTQASQRTRVGYVVDAEPGDLLLFTNLPPTFHQAEVTEPRETAFYESWLLPPVS